MRHLSRCRWRCCRRQPVEQLVSEGLKPDHAMGCTLLPEPEPSPLPEPEPLPWEFEALLPSPLPSAELPLPALPVGPSVESPEEGRMLNNHCPYLRIHLRCRLRCLQP